MEPKTGTGGASVPARGVFALRMCLAAGLLCLGDCLVVGPVGNGDGSSNAGTIGTEAAGGSGGSTICGSGTGGRTTGTSAGGSTGHSRATCTYDSSSGLDSCTDQGYECSAELSSAPPATCVLPQDLVVCDGDPNEDVGCQDGGLPNGQDGGTGDLVCCPGYNFSDDLARCVYNCFYTSDCALVDQTCDEVLGLGGCYVNFCGLNPTTGVFGGPFFGTCPVFGADDGQCLSFENHSDGICFQNGTAGLGEPCNPELRYGAFSECTFGNYCFANGPGDGGLCFPITVDGGTCRASEDAVLAWTDADWAICAPDCTGSKSCDGGAPGTSCQLVRASPTRWACLP